MSFDFNGGTHRPEKRGTPKLPRFKPVEIPARLRVACNAEASLLGSIMLCDSDDVEGMADVRTAIGMLSHAQFFGEYEQVAFNIIKQLVADGKPHSAWFVSDLVSRHIGVDPDETCNVVLGWLGEVIHSGHTINLAGSVLAAWQEREAINAINAFGAAVQSGADVGPARQKLNELLATISDTGTVGGLAECSIDALFDEAVAIRTAEKTIGISSGLKALDDIIKGGAKPGQVIVVAARPSHGKSVLGCQWAYTAAKSDFPAMMISYEMRSHEIINRIISMASLRLDDELDVERFRQHPCYHPKVAGWNINRIEMECESACKTNGVKLIVVDHLRLIPKHNPQLEMRSHLVEVTTRLKQLAQKCDVPIILLAQLNRKIEERDAKVPELHDIAESGSVEQDADIVIAIWRDEISRLHVIKQRDGGETGVVPVIVHPDRQCFVEAATEYNGPTWE